MIYNISFDICATIITIFSLFTMLSKKDLHKVSNRLLLLIIITSLAACVFDISGVQSAIPILINTAILVGIF